LNKTRKLIPEDIKQALKVSKKYIDDKELQDSALDLNFLV